MVTTTEHGALVLFENLCALSRLHSLGALYVTSERVAKESGYLERDVRILFEDIEPLRYVQSDKQRTAWRLVDGVVTQIIRLKSCDLCEYFDHLDVRAIADARLLDGRWGNVCQRHFAEQDCRLGLGCGQILRMEY